MLIASADGRGLGSRITSNWCTRAAGDKTAPAIFVTSSPCQQHDRASRVDDVVIGGIDPDLFSALREVRATGQTGIDGAIPAAWRHQRRQLHPLRFEAAVEDEE